MSTRTRLLHLLADGRFHSGTDLGAQLGVTRAAINKSVQALIAEGVDLHCVTGRGYRLAEAFVPLSVESIRQQLAADGVSAEVEVLEDADSTSQALWRHPAASLSGRVCLAERQTAGRGRRGRHWVSTPCQNLLLSIAWRFEGGPSTLTGLSLAAGVAVLRVLDEWGVRDTGLKWPNDILLDGRKLAGLLVDLRGEAAGPSLAVLGLGLNIWLAERDAANIDQPHACLREQLPGPVDRNRLAASLIAECLGMFSEFEQHGFEPWRTPWEQRHLYHQQPVHLQWGDRQVAGTVVGIDPRGSLQLRDPQGQVQSYHSGEVSLRPAS